MNDEIFKEIEGFKGYLISNYGRVWSNKSNRFLKSTYYLGNYLTVMFCINGRRFGKRIHQLVAQHFIPNPQNYQRINHINEIKEDNRVENLEWCSHQYNCEHSNARYYELESPSGERVYIYNLNKFAREHNFKHSHLHEVAKGEKLSYRGYTNPNIDRKNKSFERSNVYLESPEGKIYHVKNIRGFARERNLDDSHLCKVANGKAIQYKGWKLTS